MFLVFSFQWNIKNLIVLYIIIFENHCNSFAWYYYHQTFLCYDFQNIATFFIKIDMFTYNSLGFHYIKYYVLRLREIPCV